MLMFYLKWSPQRYTYVFICRPYVAALPSWLSRAQFARCPCRAVSTARGRKQKCGFEKRRAECDRAGWDCSPREIYRPMGSNRIQWTMGERPRFIRHWYLWKQVLWVANNQLQHIEAGLICNGITNLFFSVSSFEN